MSIHALRCQNRKTSWRSRLGSHHSLSWPQIDEMVVIIRIKCAKQRGKSVQR
ncbi:hypothetical protein B0O95_10554 [Mycetohabitans endofungorum]|uniref:Uncharacterized protein n=1 Tax=Mycetohabitans endofungorum TaxID=417203 RepID=A0A2P5KAY5_9BURK|nr:hypothetical protein B0O95_10554 [Mycetohabitans endofungorum]